MTWTAHYATMVPYTLGYYRALSPTMIDAALESRGVRAPDLRGALNYCELGMGYGVSLLAHAACFPHMHFYGTDANPLHANYAREAARDAALDNVTVFDDTIEALLERDLPAMDFIVLHGVYTWVSADCQGAIARFIRKHLRLGGVVYVSYNSMPGWASLMPLRDLLRQHGWRMSAQADSPDQRMRQSIRFVDQVEALGAAYFSENSQVPALLAQLRGAPSAYMAHEYFNPEWGPKYFHEVAAAMGEAGLGYACPAHLDHHVVAAVLNAQQRHQLDSVEDLVMRETLLDVFICRRLRCDLYTRGACNLLPREQTSRLLTRRWQLVDARSGITLKRLSAQEEGVPDAGQCHAVLDALALGAATLAELLSQPSLAEFGLTGLLQALQLLSGLGHVQPALPPELAQAAQASVQRFNAVVLARAGGDGLQHLACPLTGQAVGWTAGGMVQIRLARQGVDDPVVMAQALQTWRRESLAKDADTSGLADPVAELTELVAHSRAFLATERPVLQQLGML